MGKISYVFFMYKGGVRKVRSNKGGYGPESYFLCVLSGEVQIGACTGKQRCL